MSINIPAGVLQELTSRSYNSYRNARDPDSQNNLEKERQSWKTHTL